MTSFPDIAPDPKSRPAAVAGSITTETTTVTETVSYEAACPGCGTRYPHADRGEALTWALACCTTQGATP